MRRALIALPIAFAALSLPSLASDRPTVEKACRDALAAKGHPSVDVKRSDFRGRSTGGWMYSGDFRHSGGYFAFSCTTDDKAVVTALNVDKVPEFEPKK